MSVSAAERTWKEHTMSADWSLKLVGMSASPQNELNIEARFQLGLFLKNIMFEMSEWAEYWAVYLCPQVKEVEYSLANERKSHYA